MLGLNLGLSIGSTGKGPGGDEGGGGDEPTLTWRYWRIIALDGVNAFWGISEIELHVEGVNQVGGMTATLSVDPLPGGFGAVAALTNGNFSDFCYLTNDNTFPQWVMFDLGEGNEVTIDAFLIAVHENSNRQASDLAVQASNDTMDWTTAHAEFGLTGGSVGSLTSYDIPPAPNYHDAPTSMMVAVVPEEFAGAITGYYADDDLGIPPFGTLFKEPVADHVVYMLVTFGADLQFSISPQIDLRTKTLFIDGVGYDLAEFSYDTSGNANRTTYVLTPKPFDFVAGQEYEITIEDTP